MLNVKKLNRLSQEWNAYNRKISKREYRTVEINHLNNRGNSKWEKMNIVRETWRK